MVVHHSLGRNVACSWVYIHLSEKQNVHCAFVITVGTLKKSDKAENENEASGDLRVFRGQPDRN